MKQHHIRIKGNGHEFNILVRAKDEDTAVERTQKSVLTAKKYAKVRAKGVWNVLPAHKDLTAQAYRG